MRGALVCARPPSAMASSISSADASRAAVHSGNRALSDAKRALRVHVGGVLREHGEDELVHRRVARREHGAAVEVVEEVGRLPEPLLG